MNKGRILIQAEYIKIIYSAINYRKSISITQLVFSSFCIKRCMTAGDNLGHLKYNVFEKTLERLRAQFLMYKDDFGIIFDAINILNKTGYLNIEGSIVYIAKKRINDVPTLETKQEKLLSEISKMNDSWFIEEIINYV